MPPTLNVGFRSPFVNATAWLFIVLAAVSAACVWAAPLVAAMFPAWAPRPAALPGLSALIVSHLGWVIVATTVLAAAVLACATGLLLRLEWARRVFIALLAVMLAAHLAGLWVQHEVLSTLLEATLRLAPLPASAVGLVGGFARLTQLMGFVLTLCACLLVLWMMRGLMSDSVRREFA